MNLILFDVDGTLLDSSGVHTVGMMKLLDEMFGIQIEGIEWGEFEHVTDTFVISELFRRHLGRDPKEEELLGYREAYVGQLEKLQSQNPESFREIQGARAMMRSLESLNDWVPALATGGAASAALRKLGWAGFDVENLPGGFAEDGVSREEIIQAAIRKSLARHPVESFERIISVGDGLWDLAAARSLGLEFIAIASRGNREELEAAGADRCFDFFHPEFHELLNTPK